MANLEFRPEARLDLESAYNWYAEQHTNLGEEFLDAVEDRIQRIQALPESYPVVHRNTRRALLERFPYGIFYLVEESKIVVIAVFHARQDPNTWQDRLSE